MNYALNFITSNGKSKVGIIGGEPTLHHNFSQVISILNNHPKIKDIIIFTNGIELEQYIPLLNKKFKVLFNCNTEPNITKTQYNKMLSSIEKYFSSKNMGMLGINLFNNNVDFNYIFELAKRYHMSEIRVSLTVPNLNVCTSQTYFQYFEDRKEALVKLSLRAQKEHIKLGFDCDIPPICELCKEPLLLNNMSMNMNACCPIIDITQNLEAIRCFGTSHLCKVNIKDFPDIKTLKQHFIENIDKPALALYEKEGCEICTHHRLFRCYSGCIKFKSNKLQENNNGTNKI